MKETKEAVIAINELSILLCEKLKDGFQLTDDVSAIFQKFSTDAEFMEKVKAGYKDIALVPTELKAADLSSSIELVTIQVGYLPKIVEALKK
jgi:hypothetical protein